MTRKELATLRKTLFAEMVSIFELCVKQSRPIHDGLDDLAALRHLYEATCRELDDADLDTGKALYLNEIGERLDFIADHCHEPDQVRPNAEECRELVAKLEARGGA